MLGSEPIDGSRGASQTSGGKKWLIVGIANDQSIAWGCAKAFRAFERSPG